MFWIQFIISSIIIVFAGIKLTGYADVISDRLGWGKVWIGVLLLGLVTSLPEAITSFTSILYLQADNLAVGNLLGSNVFNPMIIVVLDILYRRGSVTNIVKAERSHNISAIFAILLVAIALFEMLISLGGVVLSWGRLSFWAFALGVLYFRGMKMLSNTAHDSEVSLQEGPENQDSATSLGAIYAKALISAIVIIVSAIFLSSSADMIAESTGLGRTFVGSIFLAFATSLPELVVSISALRLGAIDMAIGNIFGSNMTNMFILVLCGLLRGGNPILSVISGTHIVTAVISIILMLIILLGIHKKKKTIFSLGWDSFVMLAVFIVGMRILYVLK